MNQVRFPAPTEAAYNSVTPVPGDPTLVSAPQATDTHRYTYIHAGTTHTH